MISSKQFMRSIFITVSQVNNYMRKILGVVVAIMSQNISSGDTHLGFVFLVFITI